jgi:hypothetical protein
LTSRGSGGGGCGVPCDDAIADGGAGGGDEVVDFAEQAISAPANATKHADRLTHRV